MLAAVFVGGGCLASIPPLSLALQGAIANPDEYERSNSIFNVFFATGLLMGPFLTGRVSETMGRASIIEVFASLWIVMIVLSLIFRKDDPATRSSKIANR
jgi:predicted MFS family arabinose efflux permease